MSAGGDSVHFFLYELVLLGGKVSYLCLIGGILVKTIAMGNNSMV